jgi:hypothetical protein
LSSTEGAMSQQRPKILKKLKGSSKVRDIQGKN